MSQYARWGFDALAEANLFWVKTKTSECPYCANTFKPRWYPRTETRAQGSWQRFCSELCRRLWHEEKREAEFLGQDLEEENCGADLGD